MSYVFGPVPSRRLGRSLGVDVVPFKTCTYDCIYCQLGRTTCRTVKRKEWVPLEDLLDELEAKLATRPDYITLSGSGEPTLFSRLGDLIVRIKGITDIPVALLTNGSLLWQPDVREAIENVDLLIPSLDAGDEELFRRVNRPHEAVSFQRLIDGLLALRETCRGQIWLEVLLLAEYTSREVEVVKLARWVDFIRPHRVQLNSVTRPPGEGLVGGVSHERLGDLADLFNPPADVIADYCDVRQELQVSGSRKEILELLQRRPCSVEDVADGLNMHPNEVVKYVEALQAEKLLETTWTSGKCYYITAGRDRPTDQTQSLRNDLREVE